MKNATLQFQWGDEVGFTSAGISRFHDVKPVAVIRELIQNSSDAARPKTACVRFEITEAKLDEIPGISEYKQAFKDAERDQIRILGDGRTSNHVKTIVKSMKKCLESESVEVLSVIDNGVGLDEQRMRALLGDGISYQNDCRSSGA